MKQLQPLLRSVAVLLVFTAYCKRDEGPRTVHRAGAVQIQIKWENKEFPLTMRLYEPAVQRPLELWDTRVVNDLGEAPVSQEIGSGSFELTPGSKKMFVLVLKNETGRPAFFFAAPHRALPEEYALGFKFKCLCINHAWEVPPGQVWYRVVELRLASEFRGDNLSITHTLVGITEERMREFARESEGHPAGHGMAD